MSCYQCTVCSLPFQSLVASMYCSERCYIVEGMAYYYQSFSNTTCPPTSTATAATATAAATATSAASNWSLRNCVSSPTSEYDAIDLYYYHEHSVLSPPVRKNKTLPPPTLSPILMSTPSQATRRTALTSTTMTTRSRSSSVLSANSWSADSSSSSSMNTSVSSGSSCTSSDDGEEDPLSANWPKMDRLASSSFDLHLSSNGSAQWDPISMGWTTTSDSFPTSSQTRSKLPPPGSAWEMEGDLTLSSSPRKYLALSASIWGPGWHQVEPLPPSFVKTLEQSELELQAQAQALALEKAALAATNPKAIAKKAKREAKAAAAALAAAAAAAQDQGEGQSQDVVMTDDGSCSTASASASASDVAGPTPAPINALCSSRLPRSLQFVD
ncbi:hypothetical protein EC957_009230 [Mortierella hygrophila]|uniref:Uncharacterized protein n=1 Tax=Mortierella hygrophila TaxID=979708 RepID=A0A9P6K8L2_9FUNG|nr:hypothetical protein EC957_009230 [Mortierella hygrophila]